MAAADHLERYPGFEIVEPVRCFASPEHNEIRLDTLREQQNAIGRKPMLENTFRFAPFPGYVGNQSLQRAREPGIQFMIVHLIEKDWVAGFLLRNQLVAKKPDLDFQDRLFQPLTHPSA